MAPKRRAYLRTDNVSTPLTVGVNKKQDETFCRPIVPSCFFCFQISHREGRRAVEHRPCYPMELFGSVTNRTTALLRMYGGVRDKLPEMHVQ